MKKLNLPLLAIALLAVIASCSKEELPAEVKSLGVEDVNFTSAKVIGEIINPDNQAITRKGVCYVVASTDTPAEFTATWPDLSHSVVESSDANNPFATLLTSLEANKTYYLRTFIESPFGASYGEKLQFSTNAYVKTLEVTEINDHSAKVIGEIINPASQAIIRKGVCYVMANFGTPAEFTATWPDLSHSVVESTDANNPFATLLTNLDPNRTYYLRTFVENQDGIKFGDKLQFTTEFGMVTDIDGNQYRVVKIGNQYWTADNLKVTRLRDGTPIPLVTGEFITLTPAMCYYDDNPQYAEDYGALYNGHAAINPLIAPEGWRVPHEDDFVELFHFLGGTIGQNWSVGGPLKETGLKYWDSPNVGATNSTGFSGRGAGYRTPTQSVFSKRVAWFWSTTFFNNNPATQTLGVAQLGSFSNEFWVASLLISVQGWGLSIRLIKNQPPGD